MADDSTQRRLTDGQICALIDGVGAVFCSWVLVLAVSFFEQNVPGASIALLAKPSLYFAIAVTAFVAGFLLHALKPRRCTNG